MVMLSHRALLGVALLALVACGTAGQGITSTPTVLPTATSRSPSIAFPQLAPQGGNRAQATARLIGTLRLVDGCLRVTPQGGSDYLLVWPSEVALRTDGCDIRVVDATGQVVARVGAMVDFGGGELPTSAGQLTTPVRSLLSESPPARCPGPYWIAEIIKPARSTAMPR